eukprot:GSA120T00018343001.1
MFHCFRISVLELDLSENLSLSPKTLAVLADYVLHSDYPVRSLCLKNTSVIEEDKNTFAPKRLLGGEALVALLTAFMKNPVYPEAIPQDRYECWYLPVRITLPAWVRATFLVNEIGCEL